MNNYNTDIRLVHPFPENTDHLKAEVPINPMSSMHSRTIPVWQILMQQDVRQIVAEAYLEAQQ